MTSHLPRLLANLGMAPLDGPAPAAFADCYEVVLDGRVVGMVAKDVAPELAKNLGTLKAKEEKGVGSLLKSTCCHLKSDFLYTLVDHLVRFFLQKGTSIIFRQPI